MCVYIYVYVCLYMYVNICYVCVHELYVCIYVCMYIRSNTSSNMFQSLNLYPKTSAIESKYIQSTDY